MGTKPVWFFLLFLALYAPTADAATRRVSVEQLERLLLETKSKGDAEQAKQLVAVELTERLSAARLAQLKAELPGEKSQQALLAMADVSAFLAPPADEIPATAPPDQASQRRMMARTVDYLAKTLPLLPNLFATRDTTRFETRPSLADTEINQENPLRAANRSVVTVFYRDGQEFVSASKGKDAKTPGKGLTTWGEFGPILSTIVIDAAQSQLTWSHWELSSSGPQAVFRYSVPTQKSHYNVHFCCVTESYGLEQKVYTQRVGYHGEIAIDPDSGTILRLTVTGDFDPGNPIARASLLVEYGPQGIGGKSYVCPVHGIALAESPDLKRLSTTLNQLREAAPGLQRSNLQKASLSSIGTEEKQILLNDVAFREYHLFRSDSRVLSAKEAQDALQHTASPNVSSSESAKPAAEAAAEPISEPTLAAVQPAAEVAALVPPPTAAPPIIPEIYVTGTSSLPDAASIQVPGTSDAAVRYRINARLVDVSLVALDKKGRPITNLNPADLEIYDNGTKVDVHSFSQATQSAPPPAPSASVETQPGFSNRNLTPAQSDLRNTIILLIDSALSFDDLQNAREQMEHFAKGLGENERIAVYVMRRSGFQILQNTTSDHLLVANTLAKWTPSAENVAFGQEQEARNRQQMEFVRNTEDLLSVNGHGLTDTQAQTQALDPQLREMGDNPGRDAPSLLVLLARHLASVPGHKSLVWIASDNVLADWTQASINIDKGSRYIEPAALHAQEAMNEAHVSVYPLDASRLEAGGLDASVANINVQLNPTATANQGPGGCGALGPSAISPEQGAGPDISTCGKSLTPGRLTAQMQQDLHSIQGVYREIADATGGRTFRRASDLVGELNSVAADGRATYLLSFAPPQAADDKYHFIKIKLVGRKDVTLRYRTGYFYRQEPTTLKDRFREAVLQPDNVTDIGVIANVLPDSKGRTVKLAIAAADVEMAQQDSFWSDKLDIYLVQREVAGTKAHVSGQSMSLRLLSGTYQKYLQEGIPFNQALEVAPGIESIRIIVVDENSGRMGSVTIPVSALGKQT